jgi:cellobiose phosphorylase
VPAVFGGEEPPLRAELFSVEQMERHGARLAATHQLRRGRVPDQLLSRLAGNERVLGDTCDLLAAAVAGKHRITPAGEWLLDNVHLIQEQILTARRHLPKGYSRELPSLAEGVSAGLPRVYDIALETIAHGDGRVDPETLRRFIAAYQTVATLRLGELWAIPIMLRLALIENLRRVAVRVAAGRADRDLAVSWARRLTEILRQDPKNLILVMADMARSLPPMTTPFVSELARRLQGRGAALALPLTWIEQHLAESGLSIEQLVRSGNQRQAADQVSISNSIGSLRLLSTMDWREFVEGMSLVEEVLREDPGGAYPRMEFASRDNYRHVVERVAKTGGLPEEMVARHALDLARDGAERHGAGHRTAHVGYHLIDQGLTGLEQATGARLRLAARLRRQAARAPLALYLAAISLITLSATTGLAALARADGPAGWILPPVILLALLAASQLAVAVVNWLATLLASPHMLPRMDFSAGIPPASRTLVVVPTLLTHPQGIDHLAEALEVRFLGNRDPNVLFGLLTDFPDAEAEELAGDGELLQQARERIESLNARYKNGDEGSFFLFHRPRRWNPHDRTWMGHERKRGKLADLNRLLREGDERGFSLVAGPRAMLAGVVYVITLDTDTLLPRDAARRLVGSMAHPLNRPVYSETLGRVIQGYGILQQRVSASLPGAGMSLYARLHGGEPGIDPYTRTVSDVYQDVFGEGSFIGKGIYEVETFERSLRGRLPENRILSHDLLEGCHARSGLLSDVQVFEEYPSRYGADVDRRTRWIRGDWQIASWLLPRVPGPDGRSRPNPLSALSHWKVFDNLRRSLVPAALTLLLLLGWTVFAAAGFWTLAVLGVLAAPPVLAILLDAIRKPAEAQAGQHLALVAHAARRRIFQTGLNLSTLPHEAWYSLGAILRTVGRLCFTHRRLLEWNSSGEQEKQSRGDLATSLRSMAAGPLLAAGTAAWLAISAPATLAVAGPVLLLWLGSPFITWMISRPVPQHEARLSEAQRRFLARTARKTWAFFETFVGAGDNWLPPDNHQEYREATLAHRTSPTNMGLSLLATLAAHDFGYLTAGQLLERTARTLETMAGLERHRGHFYNWYDTILLKPLPPAYISTVDSGNLGGHLLTLRAGLLSLLDRPILGDRWLDGVLDTLEILEESAGDDASALAGAFRQEVASALRQRPTSVAETRDLLEELRQQAGAIAQDRRVEAAGRAGWWSRTLADQCEAAHDELALLSPWPEPSAGGSGNGRIPTLEALSGLVATAGPLAQWQQLDLAIGRARIRIAEIRRLARLAGELAEMDYSFLYDRSSHLLSIGYRVDERRLDGSCYDLLASEARLAVFVAIAQGQVPQEGWFALGRLLTTAGGEPTLMSWSGSMFEYLMPLLVMPTFEHTLLHQTARAAVARQIEHGRQLDLPWGMSESGYNTVDAQLNYQYRAFGVPGLGLKRGLAEDVVVAPYATALALMVAPEEACRNLQRLSAAGAEGSFGFHEAIDYTPARQRRGESQSLVRSYMAHHQGMSLLALAHLLLDRPLQRYFTSEPIFQATLLLLQERIPRSATIHALPAGPEGQPHGAGPPEMSYRVLSQVDAPVPEVQLLSNGRYHVMVTHAGGGSSRWMDLAVSRWREDATRDAWGIFCYLRDVESGTVWSTTHHPTRRRAEHYEAIFSEGRAEFHRRDRKDGFDFEAHTDIVVSPEDDIELRRVRITNRAAGSRTIEITTYAEVVLAPQVADELHPAFSNLFVQTEIIPGNRLILATRRPRSRDERVPWMLHLLAVHDAVATDYSCGTDRAHFLGRGRDTSAPRALDAGGELDGRQGSVLDPVAAIRCRITLEPEQTVTVDLVYGLAVGREEALALAGKYQDRRLADRVFELAWTHAQVVLRQINAREADAQLYCRLANTIMYSHASLRADHGVLAANRRGQSGLWSYAISGDLPIVLVRIADLDNIDLVRQLIQAHAYWRLKGLAVDLVIWNEDRAGYRQVLQDQILGLVAGGRESTAWERPGGVFVRSVEQIAEEDRLLFQSVARVILSDSRGSLVEQVDRGPAALPDPPRLAPARTHRPGRPTSSKTHRPDLILGNGIGGFTPDGREYVITTMPGQLTPAPWVNVLANPFFGTVVSESGQAYTWGTNAHEYRLTPWHNDPVSDAGGEATYLRDEESSHVWSPTPLPRRGSTAYACRHGFGYSVFEHVEESIRSELWVFVDMAAAVKFTVLKVRNESDRPRRLSATGYVEWVLGDLRTRAARHVCCELDAASGAILARSHYNTEFPGHVAFFDVDEAERTFTCDRAEFIGRNGSLANPAALGRTHLSGRRGCGLDPCAAIQVAFELAPGQEREIRFRLGLAGGPGEGDVSRLLLRHRGADAARRALEGVWQYWNHTLGAVQVETPDSRLNVLANGWLLYQTLACRMWGRSGAYQSGGAFGFRDQLQDAMALLHAEPRLLRAHIILCASRQFLDGDVQHWWHPPSGRGVRSHCSDDYLWLVQATCHYVEGTGDTGVLDEASSYLEGRPLNPHDESYYDLPGHSAVVESLYQHCVRAIQRGLAVGAHGLPLIGSGDWNDGMNRVGIEGRGESVWLGFFLCDVLRRFSPLARRRGDAAFADRCDESAAQLRANLERHAWDGAWYRRAWFDDGTPLGSGQNSECRIDSIPQSWSVLSGAGSADHVRQAMEAVDERLVRRDQGIVQLLDPPFDKTELDPGYIKGYVPGVRENGGQYTHAAIWAAMAFAALGDRRRAWELAAMINPVNHAASPEAMESYLVEPYVMAADIYAVAPHTGRGGWTWYTGSAGLMYRLLVESLLGLRLEGDHLHLAPLLPAHWPGVTIHYRHRETVYHIEVEQVAADDARHGGPRIWVDGVEQGQGGFRLVDDQREHAVTVRVPVV